MGPRVRHNDADAREHARAARADTIYDDVDDDDACDDARVCALANDDDE